MTSLEECCDGVVANLRADGLHLPRLAARALCEALEHEANPKSSQHAKPERRTRKRRHDHQCQTNEDSHAATVSPFGEAVK